MLRFRSLWQASLKATKKALTWNVEDLIPPTERCIFNFNSKEELKRWHLYSDSEYREIKQADPNAGRHLCIYCRVVLGLFGITDAGKGLSGVFSGDLLTRYCRGFKMEHYLGGFCGMRSKLFDGFIDLDPFDTIALKIKGDGRCYISTIYTENWSIHLGNQRIIRGRLLYLYPKTAGILQRKHYRCKAGNESFLGCRMSLSVNAEGGVPGARSGPGEFRIEIDWIKALRTQNL